MPDRKTLLVSQVGTLGLPSPGSLVFFDAQTLKIRAAYPTAAVFNELAGENWGASNCPGKPAAEFSPLGISVKQRDDGRWQVAAVNHGQGMRVEMFELLKTGEQFGLSWRGCVVPPAEVSMNSVVLLRNGGFVASHMFDRTAPNLFGLSTGIWKSQLGFDTGYAFEWLPAAEQEFRVLKGSRGPFLNGIELSADERTVFVSVTSGNEVRKIDRGSGDLLAAVRIERPDNIRWDEHGFLLVASLTGSRLENLSCIKNTGENCGLAFDIVRINPENMATQEVFKHAGPPMGAATVAQQLGDSIYLGSFTGDRILKIPYKSPAK
ncbi:hypothetical protein LNV07_21275 [Paucibacter oligotrophus]|uniref:SMP-30/Gluconolactonase/LRE-like region domain-containing protein n=1 Tax=Roseateles oligotrophus TaxID=1769250 RepID=A0ABT2YKP7_9BURK|nr:hypothetical protein [Roseateles oligotrophus]